MKPYSVACERNQDFILTVLRDAFARAHRVLEIGSGTGQHAVHFARHLPQLVWQTSDLQENHPAIRLWLTESALTNILPPIALDANDAHWPPLQVDAAFSANSLHIMSWQSVCNLFGKLGLLLPHGAPLCIYGPFNYRGDFTSTSNARFDVMLRSQDPESGIRDFEKVCELARLNGFSLLSDHAMPANNRILEFRREESSKATSR